QVVLRTSFASDRSFRELLVETREQVYQALDHQPYPFGLLVKHLQPRRDPSRSPVFQSMFIWDKPRALEPAVGRGGNGAGPLHLGWPSPFPAGSDFRTEPLLMEQCGAEVDVSLIIFELGDELVASFRYNTDLFDAATLRRWAGHFDTLLAALVDAPDQPVG